MSDGLSSFDTGDTIYCTLPAGVAAAAVNAAASAATAASQGGYNAFGLAAMLGADASGLDDTGTGVMGGLAPSTALSADSGIGGSGSGANTTCMLSGETNSATGNPSKGQSSEGLGFDPGILAQLGAAAGSTAANAPCPGIGVPNYGGLNGVSDASDPTDFLYSDNADGM